MPRWRAADLFDAKVIVVHAGGGGERVNLEETARQFRLFGDPRIVIENLPYEAEDVEGVMHGTTPEQIKYVTDYAGCGFCFDFSHAVCAANSLGLDIEKQLSGFYKLNPTVYHLCDGDINGTEDRHMHYGEGVSVEGVFAKICGGRRHDYDGNRNGNARKTLPPG